jgi:hypothetical protein
MAVSVEFAQKVLTSVEYTIFYLGVDEIEAERRRTEIRQWLDELQEPVGFGNWTRMFRADISEEAQKKARRILLEHLSPEQLEEYTKDNLFHVTAQNGRRFRIKEKGVTELNEAGEEAFFICSHPKGKLPSADVMLAQKLALEINSEVMLSIANRRSMKEEQASNELTNELARVIAPLLNEEEDRIRMEDFRRRVAEALEDGARRYGGGQALVAIEEANGEIKVVQDPVVGVG